MHATRLDGRVYETAERLLRHNRRDLVLGTNVRPRWIEDGSRFWYTVGTPEGKRFIQVDTKAGVRDVAFDHKRLADALAAESGQEVDAAALPFFAVELTTGAVEFDAFGAHWRVSLDDYACQRSEGAPPGNPLEVASPDRKFAVYRAGHDLRARSLDGSRDWALTSDGTEDVDYGASPDYLMYSTLLAKVGLPHLPPCVAWSPDGTRLLTHRTDNRGVRRTHLVDSAPAAGGEPKLLSQRYPHPGDDSSTVAEFVVIDIESGTVVTAQADPVGMSVMSPIFRRWAWWAEDGSAVYYLGWGREGVHTLSLYRLDPESGEVRTVVGETGETRVEPAQRELQQPMVRLFSGGRELLWYSQRDGWGHLYLYDTDSGELRGQVTSGPWAVQEILRVDEERRVVHFVASGLVEEDPYRRTVCRVNLDGSGFAKVTDDAFDHVVTVAENGEFFIDSASTTDTPPTATVRDWDGKVLVELERADITRLTACGWSAPERFRVTGADGETEIYGLLYRPHGFDPSRRYPVIDHPHALPMDNRVSPSFDPGWYGYEAEALAALGFVVIAVDGAGTPGRGKAFHDATYGKLAAGLADHASAVRELAATRPWMDLDRVGATGTSAGGFAALRALLDFPELFKVGVAESGMHDFRYLDKEHAEAYHGPFDEAGYAATSNVDAADRLEGKLLLLHGGLDDRVSPDLTLRLADALIAADKDFDLVIVPGADHMYFGYEHYVNRRKWDFLVRHLLGVEPPADYRLSPVPMDMEALAELFG